MWIYVHNFQAVYILCNSHNYACRFYSLSLINYEQWKKNLYLNIINICNTQNYKSTDTKIKITRGENTFWGKQQQLSVCQLPIYAFHITVPDFFSSFSSSSSSSQLSYMKNEF